ncbi:potassium channel family protein [Chloroflexota bacterium]
MKIIVKRLSVLFVIVAILVLIGTIGFSVIENLSLFDAFYFTVVTIATVGYGDISPLTVGGRVLAIILITTGVGTFAGMFVNTTQLLVERRDEQIRGRRINTLIGLYFTEVGSHMLHMFTGWDTGREQLGEAAHIEQQWNSRDFTRLKKRLQNYKYNLDHKIIEYKRLNEFLGEKSDMLFRMLENTSLTERESFTELLRATFHLREELAFREEFTGLPESDLKHLAIDARRVYRLVTILWVDHMFYMKTSYPYLFALSLRINPFKNDSSPIVK